MLMLIVGVMESNKSLKAALINLFCDVFFVMVFLEIAGNYILSANLMN